MRVRKLTSGVNWHWALKQKRPKTRPWCVRLNLLKSTGYVMHQQFNIQQLYVLPGHVARMKGEVCIRFWWGNLRERDHLGDQDVDGRIILRWIFRKWEGVVGTRWGWLRIGTGGGGLWVRQWTFGFHKMRGISWLAAKLVSFSRRTLLHGVSK